MRSSWRTCWDHSASKGAERDGIRMHGVRNRSDVAALLARRGLRATAPRRAILAYLLRRGEHLAPTEIFEDLRRAGRPVSIATLYQNLAALVAGGLLRRFAGPDGAARYDVNLAAHHHLVCERCGRIVDVEVPADAGVRPVASRRRGRSPVAGWQVRAMQVEFRGTCPECRRFPRRARGTMGGTIER